VLRCLSFTTTALAMVDTITEGSVLQIDCANLLYAVLRLLPSVVAVASQPLKTRDVQAP
jgi:hypothetical protein